MKRGSSLKRGLGTSESSEEKMENTTKRYRKRESREKMADVVRNIYKTCREVFANGEAGYVPPPHDVERLKSVLDGVKPEDLNLTPNMPFFRGTNAEEAPRITYIDIYECSKFTIGIFCLPPSAVIPLHDHPSMTVFSKLLFGSLSIKSYDWVDTADSSIDANADRIRNRQQSKIRLAKVHVDSDVTAPCDTSVLFPAEGGNMHRFRALTPCAILDVLGPPYSESEGRHWATELQPGEDTDKYGWLEEIAMPEDLTVDGVRLFPNLGGTDAY